ncbi:MAG: hypothetical protein LQ340_003142 [Diploschistes diacapsis]|nr:MAG: hypothetical protein LQ340_003142 [Diploschistes diacapsis]
MLVRSTDAEAVVKLEQLRQDLAVDQNTQLEEDGSSGTPKSLPLLQRASLIGTPPSFMPGSSGAPHPLLTPEAIELLLQSPPGGPVEPSTRDFRDGAAVYSDYYGSLRPPPESLVRTGVAAYFEVLSCLFFFMTREEGQSMIESAYYTDKPLDTAMLCQLYALAAVGSCYDSAISPQESEQLFRTALSALNDCAEASSLNGIRALICMAGYGFIKKRESIRVIIASGVQFARWSSTAAREVDSSSHDAWMRIYRTLISINCCVYLTFGHPLVLDLEEKGVMRTLMVESQSTLEYAVQKEFAHTVSMMVEIVQETCVPISPYIDTIWKHKRALDDWRDDLSAPMQLAALTRPGTGPYPESARMSLLLVHMLYLSAIIALYRPILVAMAGPRSARQVLLPDVSAEYITKCCNEAITAAHHLVRIANLVSSSPGPFKRCSLCDFQVFAACAVLLNEAAQKLVDPAASSPSEELERSRSCVDMLVQTGSHEVISRQFADLVLPVYKDLCDLNRRRQSSEPISEAVTGISSSALELLCIAFSHFTARINDDEAPV